MQEGIPMTNVNDVYNALKLNLPVKDLELTLDQKIQIEQNKLLGAINGKLTFFVVLVIIGLLLQFLGALTT
jgi:hypothetical protein